MPQSTPPSSRFDTFAEGEAEVYNAGGDCIFMGTGNIIYKPTYNYYFMAPTPQQAAAESHAPPATAEHDGDGENPDVRAGGGDRPSRRRRIWTCIKRVFGFR
ncbi:hypothetical protein HWV62_22010 [Athelia sp. TMB]|nr:hypothetical protein HWV62_6154 [Athelia sp. TMB]KAF7971131.1 hypothetical protein HWV62_22010 [Athelia sp. TMB]